MVTDAAATGPQPGPGDEPEHDEPHEHASSWLNWLRAAVLGANDGIVSTAGLVMGVAGATTDRNTIFLAGLAGLVAGALSMAAGEYVSVSTQRDTEMALIAKERRELEEEPEEELAELRGMLEERGLDEATAAEAAEQLTAWDALRVHAFLELGIRPDELTNPWHAALASMVSFAVGALLPLLTITLVGESLRALTTVVAVVLALALTGWASARFAEAPVRRAVVRNVGGGLLAMGVTYLIGQVAGRTVV